MIIECSFCRNDLQSLNLAWKEQLVLSTVWCSVWTCVAHPFSFSTFRSPLLHYLLHSFLSDCLSAPIGSATERWFHPARSRGPWWAPGGTGNPARSPAARQIGEGPAALRSVGEPPGEDWRHPQSRGTRSRRGASCTGTKMHSSKAVSKQGSRNGKKFNF